MRTSENRDKVLPVLRHVITHIHSLSKSCLPLVVGAGVMEALIPFGPIVLLSMIVGSAEAGSGWEALLWRLLAGLGIIAGMQLALHTLDRFAGVQRDRCYILYEAKEGRKMIRLDYEQIEDPAVISLRQRIKDHRNWGAGVYTVLADARRLAKSTVTVLAAMIIVAPVLAEGMRGPMAFLWLGFIAATVAMALGSARLISWLSKRQMEVMNNATTANHLFAFIMKLLGHYPAGKDMRIYPAYDLIHTDIYIGVTPALNKTFAKLSRVGGMQGAINAAISALISGLSYLPVGLMAFLGGIAIGGVVLYAGSIGQFMQGFADLISVLAHVRVTMLREIPAMELMNLSYVKIRGTIPVEKRSDGKFQIEFRNVSFRYPGSDTDVLKGVNLRFHVGEKLAVVGRNGSGKTTLIKLLCRLYDPTEGEILLNGVDIRKYDYEEYMSLFSVVFQDFKIFATTLGQNVAAARDVDARRATRALEEAGFTQRLSYMPDGINTYLYKGFSEDGVEISGGEAQKVAIARALYKDAPFVVLDEPTAALDPEAEFDIYSRFNTLVQDRTSIYISHRLSSCRFCDDILVLDKGRIVQRDGHEALLTDAQGLYAKLWTAQSAYYEGDSEI